MSCKIQNIFILDYYLIITSTLLYYIHFVFTIDNDTNTNIDILIYSQNVYTFVLQIWIQLDSSDL